MIGIECGGGVADWVGSSVGCCVGKGEGDSDGFNEGEGEGSGTVMVWALLQSLDCMIIIDGT